MCYVRLEALHILDCWCFSLGVCITTDSCSSGGGITVNGACSYDPSNVKCCTKAVCGSSPETAVGPAVSCSTAVHRTCQSAAQGLGGYPAPTIPSVGACKQVAVDGAEKIVAAFPGRVKSIGCTKDCECGSGSDHCCVKGTDMMYSDAGSTISGEEIVEWVMNNRATLNLKYVFWSQRIWDPSQESVKVWYQWRPMEDRRDITQNYWDHVHVSYN
ncbi:hypothetical protein K469DRAFT_729941 [Zopfia rhizophila CBS 207.26]|uniref:ARB-07466-like C-terminal domain-containing protein n=1 Tax=Zopfia rhizophila CBS 207.26 TaxID=1314779 RepID=A0A6A6EPY1_9PEZI|nr:hypothetical protein K469DRAFT_729941 [Zopfia rhizophila CBS 207.26]